MKHFLNASHNRSMCTCFLVCFLTDPIQPKVLGIFPSGPPANLRTYSTLHPTTSNINIRATTSASNTQQKVFCLFSHNFCSLKLNVNCKIIVFSVFAYGSRSTEMARLFYKVHLFFRPSVQEAKYNLP